MKDVQKEEFEHEDILEIIIDFNKDILEEQKITLTEKLKKIISSKESITDWIDQEKNALRLNLDGFQNLMITHFNSVLLVEDQSMDYPTTDYFVYSSHNTYLKGHQLYGDSSVEMYAYAINLGCRCVELDCWDGPNNEPKITHGMTFTSDILFKDVLKNIKDNAFKKTESPFFLSIEMHCGDEQQKIMAGYFKTILVDCWIPENDGNPSFFPTPNEMKNKFIVKCKKNQEFLGQKIGQKNIRLKML